MGFSISVKGVDGAPGKGLLSGSGVPAANLGNNGDTYLDVSPGGGFLYIKANGAWAKGASIVGPIGLTGSLIVPTSGAPAASVGRDGDYAWDGATRIFYGPKANGAWPAGIALKGADGQNGVSPTLTIGNIATSAPGSAAQADISGTFPNYLLDLTLPAGRDGTGTVSSTGTIVAGAIVGYTDTTGTSIQVLSAATARTYLGLGSLATQGANAVAVTGGKVDGTPIGSTTASTGAFTTLAAASLTLTTALAVAQGGTGANTAAGARTALGVAASGANSDIKSITGLTTALSVAQGGTGATTAAAARAALAAAASGANGDITSLTGLTTALSIAQGGTGATTASAARSALGAAASGANGDITSLTGLTTAVTIAQGGTGATTAAGARTALGVAASGANNDITSLAQTLTAPVFVNATGNLGQFIAISGNFGAGLRNDGTSAFLLQTASGAQTGASNAFRPFAWNLTTGAVTIDGTGLGTSFGVRPTFAGKTPYDTGNFTSAVITTTLGFTPVQQGTGVGQNNNGIKLGWSGSALKLTVDTADQGNIWSDNLATKSIGGSTGYQKLPSGMILQWGYSGTSQGGDYTITFPISFPNACLSLTVTPDGVPPSAQVVAFCVSDVATTGYNVRPRYVQGGGGGYATQAFRWMAIGW